MPTVLYLNDPTHPELDDPERTVPDLSRNPDPAKHGKNHSGQKLQQLDKFVRNVKKKS